MTSRAPEMRGADEKESIRVGWRMSGLAFEFSTHVAAGALLGWGIDYLRGKGPSAGVLVGSVCGILVGGLQFIRHALHLHATLGPPPPMSKRPGLDEETDEDDAK